MRGQSRQCVALTREIARAQGARALAPASLKHSPSDTAGETALHVLPFRCLHLGLSGGRPLSAKAQGIWLERLVVTDRVMLWKRPPPSRLLCTTLADRRSQDNHHKPRLVGYELGGW